MSTCSKCNVENPEGAKFCFACGAPFAPACPHCHQPLPIPEAKFCPSCGQRIEAVESEKLLKLVTILFADVVSSTDRAEKMYPDEIKELMESFFAAITPEITAEGGIVDSYAGDAVMAIFGVPVAHEDDPVRAVRAARRMIAATERWGQDKTDLQKIRIRIGINTGNVLAAAGDATVRVTGDPVNVAARFEAQAPVMKILVGERTARSVRAHFNLESVGGLQMKGKSEPVPGFIIGEPKEVVEDRGIPGLVSPLIGREKELAVLQDALEAISADSAAQIVTVMAEAGVGKSRLTRELFLTLGANATSVSGRCLPYGDGVTLWPLAEILMGEAGILLTDPKKTAGEKIAKLVKTALPDAPDPGRIENGLAAALGLEDQSRTDPRELFKDIVDSWIALFTSMASERPLIVLVEDIHWADSTMLEVLRLLSESIGEPVLFVCTTRPTLLVNHPEWEEHPKLSTIRLQPLTAAQSEELISHLLGASDLPAATMDMILTRSEGNPFYVEEIVHRLIDDGYLQPEGDHFVASGDIELVEIPDNVQGVILARLDLLTVEQRQLIQNAAVMGRSFWVGALTATKDESERDRILDALEQRQLIHQNIGSSMGGEVEYSFKHILIRDVAYETLPRKKRAILHVEAAEWIERVSGDRAAELSEVLAHHFHQAFDYSQEDDHRQRARTLYKDAAVAACKRFAVNQGVTHAWTAVDLSRGNEEKSSAYEDLGDVHFQAFSVDAAWHAYSEGLGELLDLDPTDKNKVRMAAKASLIATRWESGLNEAPEPQNIRNIIEVGMRGVGDDRSSEKAMLLASKAFMVLNGWTEADGTDGKDAAIEALEIAKELDDANLASAALDAITYWDVPDGLYGQAAETNKQRLALIPSLSEVREICDAYMVSAWTSSFAGHYLDALSAATACVERAAATDAGAYVSGLVERVQALTMLGRWNEALTDLEEIDKIERDSGKDVPSPFAWKAYAFAALAHELLGDDGSFTAELERFRAFDAHENVRDREDEGTLRGAAMARALIHRGDLDAARTLISTAPGAVRCAHLEALCELTAAAGDWANAEEVVTEARQEAERAKLAGLACFADRLDGLLHAHNGDAVAARDRLLASSTGFGSLGARWESAFSLLLAAEAAGSLDQAASALEVFKELGAPAEIRRAEKASAGR